MDDLEPIVTAPLFPEVSERLTAMLETLTPVEWGAPVSPVWRVRDVAAHLLDSTLRRLSTQRDGHRPAAALPNDADYATLLAYLNALNADWSRAAGRLSPRVLIELIRWSDAQLAELFASLDPRARALWPVAWAGETESENWFDVAREYTEKWHHAQQIFEATGRPSTIVDRALMHPSLDALMRALPHGLRAAVAPEGARVRVNILGEAGGTWIAARDEGTWRICAGGEGREVAKVTMSQAEAWKVLMKRLPAEEIRKRYPSVATSGDERLCNAVLEMVCVMA